MKAILIDFDGTLVDSVPTLYTIYAEFLDSFGLKATPSEFQKINGIPIPQFVAQLVKRYQLPGTLVEYQQRYLDRAFACYQVVQPFPGVAEFLHQAQQKQLQLAIVTASPQRLVRGWLQKKALETAFQEIISSEHLPKSKPDPAVYNLALAELNLSPDQAVAIEDSALGITAARAAGIRTIAFGNCPRAESDIRCVSSWTELKELLL